MTRLRIAVTRATDRAESLASVLRERGADPVLLPAIECAEPTDWAPLDAALASSHDGWIFTSARAVEACASRTDLRGDRFVAAVGSGTARALEARGIQVDLLPERFHAAALLAALEARFGDQLRRMHWLVPRAEEGRAVIEAGLRASGAPVDAVVAYRTVPVIGLEFDPGSVDVVTFASGSAARSLVAASPDGGSLGGALVVTLGPATSSACRALGVRVDAEAREATMWALAEAAVTVGHRHAP